MTNFKSSTYYSDPACIEAPTVIAVTATSTDSNTRIVLISNEHFTGQEYETLYTNDECKGLGIDLDRYEIAICKDVNAQLKFLKKQASSAYYSREMA